jgi:hypothetical protein
VSALRPDSRLVGQLGGRRLHTIVEPIVGVGQASGQSTRRGQIAAIHCCVCGAFVLLAFLARAGHAAPQRPGFGQVDACAGAQRREAHMMAAMKRPSSGDPLLAVTPKCLRYTSKNHGNMRKIGGIDSSHGKVYGQAALGVRKIMWKHYHILKS